MILAIAAVLSILATPFVKFIAFRGYGFAHAEVAIVFAYLAVTAVAIAAVVMLRAETLRPLTLGLLILVFGFSEFAQLGWTPPFAVEPGSMAEKMIYGALAAVAVGAVMAGAWAARRRIEPFVVTVFGVMMVAAVIFPPEVKDTWTSRNRPAAAGGPVVAAAPLPPVVHIVFDQHIGIDGLPPEIDAGRELAGEIREFYARYGFRLFSSAFTHFPATVESIPNLLNGKVVPSAAADVEGNEDSARLLRNAWFRQLAAKGYRIDVYQSRYLDYCAPGSDAAALVGSCHTYNQADVRYYHAMDIAPPAKAKLLFAYFVGVDYQPVLYRLLYIHHRLRLWLASIGVDLSPREVVAISPSPLVSMDAMARLARRIETLRDGEAVFAHLLLPHDPYVFDRRCRLRDGVDSWTGRRGPLWMFNVGNTPEHRAARYRAYLEQVGCVYAKLGDILDGMRKRGILDKSIIVVHGDHGSMIGLLDAVALNAGKLGDRDIIDTYSTLFAAKLPGAAAGEVAAQRSSQYLFADQVAGWPGVEAHDDVFLAPNRGIVGPGQTRRPMVPIRAPSTGRAGGN